MSLVRNVNNRIYEIFSKNRLRLRVSLARFNVLWKFNLLCRSTFSGCVSKIFVLPLVAKLRCAKPYCVLKQQN